jgi:hypothetical protein
MTSAGSWRGACSAGLQNGALQAPADLQTTEEGQLSSQGAHLGLALLAAVLVLHGRLMQPLDLQGNRGTEARRAGAPLLGLG